MGHILSARAEPFHDMSVYQSGLGRVQRTNKQTNISGEIGRQIVMAKRDNLKTSTSVIIDLPAEKIDLADWIVHFSNEDYVACTPATGAHKVMYVYRGGDGRWVFRNDETAAGFMMTQL